MLLTGAFNPIKNPQRTTNMPDLASRILENSIYRDHTLTQSHIRDLHQYTSDTNGIQSVREPRVDHSFDCADAGRDKKNTAAVCSHGNELYVPDDADSYAEAIKDTEDHTTGSRSIDAGHDNSLAMKCMFPTTLIIMQKPSKILRTIYHHHCCTSAMTYGSS